MSSKHRVSLSFGDTPDEEFAFAVLQTKGRKKAVYIAQCIKAFEKRRSSILSGVPESSLTVLKTLLEQIVSNIQQPATQPPASADIRLESDVASPLSIMPSSSSESLEQSGSEINAFDKDALSQALDALSAFDAF